MAELEFEEVLEYRLSDIIEPSVLPTGEFDWSEVWHILYHQLHTICHGMEVFSKVAIKKKIKSYLLDNGFSLEFLLIRHEENIEQGVKGMLDHIVSYYKRLLAFL
jgi:hypothetical protein